MIMSFVAVDVETANADLASICQIGVAKFSNNRIDETWESLINPEDEFDFINVQIHGIDEKMVHAAPTFPEVFEGFRSYLENQIVESHMPFDRIALSRTVEKYDLDSIKCTWLDTARVARRTWTQFAYSGYGLATLAQELGVNFQHHNALEDARAAGEILIKAVEKTSIGLEDWLTRVEQPIFETSSSSKITKDGNPEGHLWGEEVVFTGTLSVPRRQIADIASQAGCKVASSVTKVTTLLVVGDQDIRRLTGFEKSSKHRKAEQLLEKGYNIRILTESDFMRFVNAK